MIKVFQAVDNPYSMSNEYVMTLMDGIDELSDNVIWGWGIDKFWSAELFDYNIVHIHWPNALLWLNRTASDIKRRLELYKKGGGRIVATCHNLQPHYSKNIQEIESYNVVYGYCDMMLHMGNSSMEIMKDKYPNALHVTLPHQTYDTIYSMPDDANEGKRLLKVSRYPSCILCFGAFRDDEERNMVFNLMKTMKHQGHILLAPGMIELNRKITGNPFILKVVKAYYRFIKGIVITGGGYNAVPKGLLPYYFAAADVVLVQRKRILNSGNIPMAFLMGKVVIGPNVGNVGELLTKTGNPTYNPDDELSLQNALIKGLELSKSKHGDRNKEYSKRFLLTRTVASQLLSYYCSLAE